MKPFIWHSYFSGILEIYGCYGVLYYQVNETMLTEIQEYLCIDFLENGSDIDVADFYTVNTI